jgi:hypothetical protein
MPFSRVVLVQHPDLVFVVVGLNRQDAVDVLAQQFWAAA